MPKVSRQEREFLRDEARRLKEKAQAEASALHTARIEAAVAHLREFCVVRTERSSGYTKISGGLVLRCIAELHSRAGKPGRPIALPPISFINMELKRLKLDKLFSKWVYAHGGQRVIGGPSWKSGL